MSATVSESQDQPQLKGLQAEVEISTAAPASVLPFSQAKDAQVDNAIHPKNHSPITAERLSSASAGLDPASEKGLLNKAPLHSRDFGILPIPSHRRHDPDDPFKFSLALNYLFAFAATFTVANLYYCQPLLVQYSVSFNISYGQATHVPTLLQGGYATGLLILSPMGDTVRRRALCLLLVVATTLLSIGLALTHSFAVFEALSFIVGFLTVTPQIMIPLAADLAPPQKRAQSMAIVFSGLLLGVLVARVLGGVIGNFTSWRNVYWLSVGMQTFIVVVLYFTLPDYPPKNPDLKYWEIHPTMLKFLYTNPVLVHGCILSSVGSAVFTSFWICLTFLLSGEPYQYSTLIIGIFGVVGIAGVCAAPFVGRLVDRLVPWVGAGLGNVLLLITHVLMLGGSQINVAFPVIAIILLDIGQQLQQVSNQSRIYATNVSAGSRLNSIYIICLFVGQLIGSSLCSKVFLEYGARPFYGLGCGMIGLNILILFARGPLKSNTKWLGWGRKEEWALVKRPVPDSAAEQDIKKKDVEMGHVGSDMKESDQDTLAGEEANVKGDAVQVVSIANERIQTSQPEEENKEASIEGNKEESKQESRDGLQPDTS